MYRHTPGHDERKRYCETFPFIFKVRKGQVFKVTDFKAQIKGMIFCVRVCIFSFNSRIKFLSERKHCRVLVDQHYLNEPNSEVYFSFTNKKNRDRENFHFINNIIFNRFRYFSNFVFDR